MVTGNVVLAPGVNIWFNSVILRRPRAITLGRRVNVQDGCILHTDYDDALDVEEGVVLGHAAVGGLRPRVGRDTLIGIGARLLSHCDVGEECLIAAGAVVTEGRRIPPRSVVMGIPGKVVRVLPSRSWIGRARLCPLSGDGPALCARAYPPPWTR